jgi:hypothetical protein
MGTWNSRDRETVSGTDFGNRRTRSISKGSSTGNIWSRRVSMTDGEVDMMLGQACGGEF